MRNTPTETSYQMNNATASNLVSLALNLAGFTVPPAVAAAAVHDLATWCPTSQVEDIRDYCDVADEAITSYYGAPVWQSKIIAALRAGVA